jgi:hypothetical protein
MKRSIRKIADHIRVPAFKKWEYADREFSFARMTSSLIHLRLCTLRHSVQEITVNSSDSVGCVLCLVAIDDPLLLCKGQILSLTESFGFYQISDNDAIVAMPLDSPGFGLARWLDVTRRPDSFNDWIRWLLEERTQHETARLRDLSVIRLERKPRQFRRWCSGFASSSRFAEDKTSLNAGYERTKSPSDLPLPVLWADEPLSEPVALTGNDMFFDSQGSEQCPSGRLRN